MDIDDRRRDNEKQFHLFPWPTKCFYFPTLTFSHIYLFIVYHDKSRLRHYTFSVCNILYIYYTSVFDITIERSSMSSVNKMFTHETFSWPDNCITWYGKWYAMRWLCYYYLQLILGHIINILNSQYIYIYKIILKFASLYFLY